MWSWSRIHKHSEGDGGRKSKLNFSRFKCLHLFFFFFSVCSWPHLDPCTPPHTPTRHHGCNNDWHLRPPGVRPPSPSVLASSAPSVRQVLIWHIFLSSASGWAATASLPASRLTSPNLRHFRCGDESFFLQELTRAQKNTTLFIISWRVCWKSFYRSWWEDKKLWSFI